MSDNVEFLSYMRVLLGHRYSEFLDAYTRKPRHKALRVNTLKISVPQFVQLCNSYEQSGVREYALKSNPLCEQSFYTAVKPSLDPLYHAGLYYMQEPSAAAAVAAFRPYIGERVLDLCAAPGGKATQASQYMNGGMLVANEIDRDRKWALIQNIERLGICNALVTSALPERLERGYHEFFDSVIVDAPCSGGGMTRYEDVDFDGDIVAGCAERQKAILDSAANMLRRGGYMLYSTCTFTVEENEDNVRYLADKGFATVDIPLLPGAERGIDCPDARRIYPMSFDGEGHFFCVLQKQYGGVSDIPYERAQKEQAKIGGAKIDVVDLRGQRLPARFVIPSTPMFRMGVPLTLGEPRPKNGAKIAPEFSHALSHGLTVEQVSAVGAVELDNNTAMRYIRGEQLDIPAPRGDVIVTINGYALGWARSAPDGAGDMALKNKYPKELRI